MSGRTTTTTAAQVQHTLNDYKIRLTGNRGVSPPNSSRRNEITSSNPDNWPQNYRRVPDHRPINRNLDWSLRPGGTNPIERAFIFTMLHGVWLNASASQAWRHTGGRINSNIFRYKIGGEW